jgi:ABC-2 type transport system permease protein
MAILLERNPTHSSNSINARISTAEVVTTANASQSAAGTVTGSRLVQVLIGLCWYLRLYCHFARVSLVREMMFRTNFVVRCITHAIWVSLMLAFLRMIFLHTQRIGDWDQNRLLFFLGTYLTLNATVNCFFMNGSSRLSELVRSGNLDLELLKPVDEQFLLTCQRIDWALFPQILLGFAVSAMASLEGDLAVSFARVLGYCSLLILGVAILYSLLVMLAAVSVWTVRHEELYELWFYLLQFGNYPEETLRGTLVGTGARALLTYVFPILLAVNVPARYGAMLLDHWKPAVYLGAAAVITLGASRAFFRFALRSYQSASS